ncbi:MAG TPA: CBS domain-containing protein [Sedimenticola thiotaurini]|uniref:CBS domain-containing protein n=1 Tax=Sedimenticola thiotaurini TaxID=1543721 RepID=A0A831RNU7_9GAMM|nr:CBS domain-containing protein [Sedimenticola thiotaurini]
MYISDIMSTHPDTATTGMKLSHAAKLMRERKRRYLPVVDDGGRLVGLFGHRELASAEPSSITTLSVGEVNYLTSKVTVGQLMRRDPPTCSPDCLVEEAGYRIREHKIGCLPVVQDDRLVGVVSETDILDFFLDITGCRLTDTTRIAVKLPDRKGSLGKLLNAINDFGGYIATVVSPIETDRQGRRTAIIRHRSDDPAALDQHLRTLGYELVVERLPD